MAAKINRANPQTTDYRQDVTNILLIYMVQNIDSGDLVEREKLPKAAQYILVSLASSKPGLFAHMDAPRSRPKSLGILYLYDFGGVGWCARSESNARPTGS